MAVLWWRARAHLLQRGELVDGGEHVDELVEALGEQVGLEEDGLLVKVELLAARLRGLRSKFGGMRLNKLLHSCAACKARLIELVIGLFTRHAWPNCPRVVHAYQLLLGRLVVLLVHARQVHAGLRFVQFNGLTRKRVSAL